MSPDETRNEPQPRYQLVDILTMGYLSIVFLGIALCGGHLENQIHSLAIHLVLFLLVRLLVPLARRSPLAWIRFLGETYPLFFLTILYIQSNLVNTLFFMDPFDPFFVDLDQNLFGVQPSFWLSRTFGTPLVHEVIHACYFSYYPLIPFVAFFLYFSRPDKTDCRRFLFTVCLTFYACYLTFILLPVHGPNALRGEDYAGGVLFVPIMNTLYEAAETGGGAFPSSHVAVALVCLLFCRRHSKCLFRVWLLPVLGLIFATVYCRYHYAVDSMAGLLVGAGFYFVGIFLFNWTERSSGKG